MERIIWMKIFYFVTLGFNFAIGGDLVQPLYSVSEQVAINLNQSDLRIIPKSIDVIHESGYLYSKEYITKLARETGKSPSRLRALLEGSVWHRYKIQVIPEIVYPKSKFDTFDLELHKVEGNEVLGNGIIRHPAFNIEVFKNAAVINMQNGYGRSHGTWTYIWSPNKLCRDAIQDQVNKCKNKTTCDESKTVDRICYSFKLGRSRDI